MASVYGQSGASSGSAYGGKGGGKPPAHSGILGNLLHDAESTLVGIPKGVESLVTHPVRTAEGLGHSYAQMYGPLFHGQLGKFAHNVEQHPLGPILDALTLVDFGGGALGRLGEGLGKAGVIDPEGALARLRVPKDLTVPGPDGEPLIVKASSKNPVRRARQSAVNDALNKLPLNTPMVGSAARAGKVIARTALRPSQEFELSARPFTQAFGRLDKTEKAAWHLVGRELDPAGYQQLITHGVVHDPKGTEAATAHVISDEKLRDLYHHPEKSAKLVKALDLGRKLSDHMTELKVSRGDVSELSAAQAPYRALRLANGAHIMGADEQKAAVGQIQRDLEDTQAAIGKRFDEARAETNDPRERVDLKRAERSAYGRAQEEAQQKISEAGDIADRQGRELPTLAQEIADKGREQPFYIPDTAETKRLPRQTYKPTGTNPPQKIGSMKRNRGVLVTKGMLNLRHDALTAEVKRYARHMGRRDVNDALAEHAAVLPEGERLPKGYSFLKINSGQTISSYTERQAPELISALEDRKSILDRHITKDESAPDIRTDAEGNRLIVPDQTAESLAYNAQPARGSITQLLYNKPTTIWKHLVLGLRPAYFVNISLGQHILGMLGMAPGRHGVSAYLDQLRPGVRPGKLEESTLEHVLPEQASGTFAQQSGFQSNRGLDVAHKAYQGVMPATIAVENFLRRVMVQGWAKATPQIQKLMRENGGDLNAALRDLSHSDPHVLDEISRRVDDALGNYRSYSPAEQKIRQLIPFYAWDRHIAKASARLISERPGIVNALSKLGAQGAAQTQAQFGDLPPYLRGVIGLGGAGKDGRTPVLATHGINPLSTDADLLRFANALVEGKAGANSEELASGLNPIISSMIEQLTGKSLLTGGDITKGPGYGALNVPVNAIMGVPQVRLLQALLGATPKTSKPRISSADALSQLLALAGLPRKKLDVGRANAAERAHPTP